MSWWSPNRRASRSPSLAVWLASLQMPSASTGWALRWTQSPVVADDGYLAPARTTDGVRAWTDVTPRAARALLATPDATVVLQALDGDRAWLAVTASTADGSSPHLTVVSGTSDGGWTWTRSAPFNVPAYARLVTFAGPGGGWLLADYGGAMGQDPVRLYRITDAGCTGRRSRRPRTQAPAATACPSSATRRGSPSPPRRAAG
jgi:hypothetical protein